jgi:hypothetical protein
MYEDQRPGQFRLAGEVRGVPANTMRVKDAKKAAKLPGGIDHAAVGRGRDIPTERRGRGVCSFGGTYPARQ